jgi:hypothetical protein
MDDTFPIVKSEDEPQPYSRQGLTIVIKTLRFARQIRCGDNEGRSTRPGTTLIRVCSAEGLRS